MAVEEEKWTGDPLDNWPDFVRACRKRLKMGRDVYGDQSFDRPPVELLGEVQEEILDTAVWSFVLWVRMKAVAEHLSKYADVQDEEAAPRGRPVGYFGPYAKKAGG